MGQKSTILAIIIIAISIIFVILFILSRLLGGSNNSGGSISTSETKIENLVPIEKIVGTPKVYEGYNIAVNSTIGGWTTSRSFYFNSQSTGFRNNKEDVILFAIAKEPFQLPEDSTDKILGIGELAEIIANGQIQILDREQLEARLEVSLEDPKVTLRNPLLENWQLGPVLLLNSVEIVSP